MHVPSGGRRHKPGFPGAPGRHSALPGFWLGPDARASPRPIAIYLATDPNERHDLYRSTGPDRLAQQRAAVPRWRLPHSGRKEAQNAETDLYARSYGDDIRPLAEQERVRPVAVHPLPARLEHDVVLVAEVVHVLEHLGWAGCRRSRPPRTLEDQVHSSGFTVGPQNRGLLAKARSGGQRRRG